MSMKLQASSHLAPYLPGQELCLRIGKMVFGVSFTDIEEARDAARRIIRSGRDVEIYEKISGKVLETSEISVTGPTALFVSLVATDGSHLPSAS